MKVFTMSRFHWWLLGIMVLLLIQANEPLRAQPFDITAEVTVDNNYSFGWGDVNGMIAANFWGPINNILAEGIYYCRPAGALPNVAVIGPEFYPNLHPTVTDYLYIVAWSDDKTFQGLIGRFTDNNTGTILYTGDPGWEVFATGINYSNANAPSLSEINQQIVLANTNSGPAGSSSRGWVGPTLAANTVGHLAVGAFNGGTGNRPPKIACTTQFPLNSGARWMWYSDAKASVDVFATQPVSPHVSSWREFLIFRMPVKQFPQNGVLKVCKVAGPGVAVGTPFNFTASSGSTSTSLTVPAGPPPGGTCVVGPSFPVGSPVTVIETPIPAGDIVSSITVAPSVPGWNVNLAQGNINGTMGSGVTEVTFTDENRIGYLEICKHEGKGSFSFTVSPGGLGPFVVPAGACSPAIAVAAGTVVITEQPSGYDMVGCHTLPPSHQGPCNFAARTSTVTVVPGDISTMTIAFIRNNKHGIQDHDESKVK